MQLWRKSSAAAKNDPWLESKQRLRHYQQLMAILYGVQFDFNFAYDFLKAGEKNRMNGNDHVSTVFLAKCLTAVHSLNENGEVLPVNATNIASVVATYYDHFDVEYTPATPQAREKFSINNMVLNYADPDHHTVGQAMVERANAALILAHSAKAAGWTCVDFADTTDPVERYFLKKACDFVGLDSSAEQVSDLSLGDPEANNQAITAFIVVSKDILKTAVIPPGLKRQRNHASSASALDSLGLDLNVA